MCEEKQKVKHLTNSQRKETSFIRSIFLKLCNHGSLNRIKVREIMCEGAREVYFFFIFASFTK